jgi:hypothetical protein
LSATPCRAFHRCRFQDGQLESHAHWQLAWHLVSSHTGGWPESLSATASPHSPQPDRWAQLRRHTPAIRATEFNPPFDIGWRHFRHYWY